MAKIEQVISIEIDDIDGATHVIDVSIDEMKKLYDEVKSLFFGDNVLDVVLETAKDLNSVGIMDKSTMNEIEALCSPKSKTRCAKCSCKKEMNKEPKEDIKMTTAGEYMQQAHKLYHLDAFITDVDYVEKDAILDIMGNRIYFQFDSDEPNITDALAHIAENSVKTRS